MLNPAEIKKRAIEFEQDHAGDADEKSQAQNFWRDFFAIWGLTPQRIGVFESRARTLKGTVGFIDFFWPGTLLVEHKSRGKDLDAALRQALDYCSTGALKETELPRYIVVSDFARIRIVELGVATTVDGGENGSYAEFPLERLHENLHRFNFILGFEQRSYRDEDPVNIAAAELMGALHDELKTNGYEGHELELFLVRLMFLFFADDTGIFPKDQFAYLMEHRTREDGSDLGPTLSQVFQVLNTPNDRRMKNLDAELSVLPYVNGGLFSEQLSVPSFDLAMRRIFLHCCLFNWSRVSPAIFGSLFQSVMDAKERRNLGAHYTSEKNILKTVHGLFLDDLQEELQKSKGNAGRLRALLSRIAGLKLLDPACGCGNFLILAYRELRLLEIEIHKEIQRLEKHKYLDLQLYRGIDVDAMCGIEIEEFPSQIARTALWIMDHLMNVRLSEEFGEYIVRLPLVATPHIVQANALRMDWRELVKPEELSYILGNPPFVGKKEQLKEQKIDLTQVFSGHEGSGILDYVTCWYIKAAQYIQDSNIRCAFVSTNSITQGEQVGILWSILFLHYRVKIQFAHRTFKWSNEAKGNAAVHCVIIGFGMDTPPSKYISEYENPTAEPKRILVKNINPYLTSGKDFFLPKRSEPICPVSKINKGSEATDWGHLFLSKEERLQMICEYPQTEGWIRRVMGGDELINNLEQFCLWLIDVNPQELRRVPPVLQRIEQVRKERLRSGKERTREWADSPAFFTENRQPKSGYLAIPKVSSERRMFIPIGYLKPDVIATGSLQIIPDATLFEFGILSSTMHNSWMRQVCGRMKSDYQYSNSIVYNNFPWPMLDGAGPGSGGEATGEGVAEAIAGARGRLPPLNLKQHVETYAQAVLDARATFPDSSLADLYDPLSMPPVLVKAHRDLDAAVDKCYRKEPFRSELERVEFLFALYERYTETLTAGAGAKKRGKG